MKAIIIKPKINILCPICRLFLFDVLIVLVLSLQIPSRVSKSISLSILFTIIKTSKHNVGKYCHGQKINHCFLIAICL